MNDGTHPTREQQEWLAGVLGQEAWVELQQKSEFNRALESSLGAARRIGLRHIAARERAGSGEGRAPAGWCWCARRPVHAL